MGQQQGPIIVTGEVVTVTGWKANRQSAQLPRERGVKFKHTRNDQEYEDWLNVSEDSPWADAYQRGQVYKFEKVWDETARNGKGGFYYLPHGEPGETTQRAQGGAQRGAGGQRGRSGGQSGSNSQRGQGRPQGGAQRGAGSQGGGNGPQARSGAQRPQGGGQGYGGWDDGGDYGPEPENDRPPGFHELVKFTDWMLSKGKFSRSPMTMLMTKLVDDDQIMEEQARWSFNQMKRLRGLVAMLQEVEQNRQ